MTELLSLEARQGFAPAGPTYGRDLAGDKCFLETSWCRGRVNGAGGFDEHHDWPKFLGGPEEEGETQHLRTLCPTHHRRVHSLQHAMILHDDPDIKTVVRFTRQERALAANGYTCWVQAGRPKIAGWPALAAAVRP